MPTSRSQYDVIESFEADNGREYAKIEYKGSAGEGFVSRVKGPGNDITEDWYKEKKREQGTTRVVVTCKYETRYMHDTNGLSQSEAKIIIQGVFPSINQPTDKECKDKMDKLQSKANEQLAFVQNCDPSIDRTAVEYDGEPPGWVDGSKLTIKTTTDAKDEHTYEIDPEQTTIDGF